MSCVVVGASRLRSPSVMRVSVSTMDELSGPPASVSRGRGVAIEVENLVFSLPVGECLDDLCTRAARGHTDALSRLRCILPERLLLRDIVATHLLVDSTLEFTLTERSGLSLGIAESEMAERVL